MPCAIAMTADQSGRLWVSISGNDVFRRDERRWTPMESLGGPKGIAITAFTGSDGRVWFGYGDKTIRRAVKALSTGPDKPDLSDMSHMSC